MLVQEVLLDADADMTAANLKTKLDASGPDACQDHAHNSLPPSQDKQPDIATQSYVQARQVARADTHSQLEAREMESEQGDAEIATCIQASQEMSNEGAFNHYGVYYGDRGTDCQTGDKAQQYSPNIAVNSKKVLHHGVGFSG